MPKILIVEDDENIRMALEDDLALEGFEVAGAADGEQGLQMAKENSYDLIILDLMLPRLNGTDVCKALRRANIFTPIIMLTAKSQEIDKILGLELGADDYVTKPFSPRELLARVKAILRRSAREQPALNYYHFGDLEIDFDKYEAKKKGQLIHLTAYEFELLRLFINNQNKVLDRDFILDEIWGEVVIVTPRTVDTHIANLRKKIEDDPADPRFIVGIRGVGYKFIYD
jgi:two-component system alkaline phosphatase synthesis response regulator PhoP